MALEDAPPDPALDPAADPAGGPPPAGDPPASPWYGDLSDDAADEKTLSDRKWIENKGYADLPSLIKAQRALEGKLAGAKGVEVPGDDATPEQVAAYRAAIGVPENSDGYKVSPPEGWEADMAIFGAIRDAAFEGGMPVAAWDATVGKAQAVIMDQYNALVDVQNAERDGLYTDWGALKDHNLMLMQRGFEAFGLTPDDVQAMQIGKGAGGAKLLMELGLKMGQASGEDGFIPGGKRAFGIAPAEARAELARLEKDGEFIAKLKDKDEAATARHERLLAVIAADDERQRRAAEAS